MSTQAHAAMYRCCAVRPEYAPGMIYVQCLFNIRKCAGRSRGVPLSTFVSLSIGELRGLQQLKRCTARRRDYWWRCTFPRPRCLHAQPWARACSASTQRAVQAKSPLPYLLSMAGGCARASRSCQASAARHLSRDLRHHWLR